MCISLGRYGGLEGSHRGKGYEEGLHFSNDSQRPHRDRPGVRHPLLAPECLRQVISIPMGLLFISQKEIIVWPTSSGHMDLQ